MANYPDHIREIVAKFDLKKDELWQVHGSTWVIKHKAIERIGVQLGIIWGSVEILEGSTADKTVVILVTGSVGERSEWSFGEASPANNKNAYPWAMAEKRGKDRVILKFLAAHGDVYSEEEADDFKEPVRQPTPVATSPRLSSNAIKKDQPQMWSEFERKMRACQTWDDLRDVWDSYSDKMPTWPQSWQESADAEYLKAEESIRARAA
jgi:hypothetical protein